MPRKLRKITRNLVGQTFNKLTALSLVRRTNGIYYLWQCECGNTKEIRGIAVSRGDTKSCGCLHGEICRANSLPEGLALIRTVICYYKRNAEKRGLLFCLSEDECIALLKNSCTYCGRVPYNTITKKKCIGELTYSGIDRKDSSLGYTKDNVTSCCKECNMAKRELSVKQFTELITMIYNNMELQNDN